MNRNEFLEALPLSHLVLKLTGASLDIAPDDSIDYISVLASGTDGDVNALKLFTTGNRLLVEQPAISRQYKPADSRWLQVTIRLPASWKGRFDIRTVTGCITAHGLRGTELALETGSGRISASSMHFISAEIRTGSGDARLTDVCFENAGLHTASGTITVQDCAIAKCTVTLRSGHASLDYHAPFDAIQANSVAGNLDVAAPITACSIQAHTSSGRVSTISLEHDESAGSFVDFSSLSGNLSITSTLPEE